MKCLSHFLLFFVSITFISCLDGPEIRLSKTDLNLVDSLYGELSDSLKLMGDSICDNYQETYFQQMVDSIVNERMMEMIKIQER